MAITKRREKLRIEAKKPPNVQLKDKISFTLGIANIVLTAFLIAKWPHHFFWVYTVKFPIMLGLRYYLYKKNKWHYFMLDFCYFANLLFMLYLHVFPSSCTLFKVSFSFTLGPLSWAIPLWRNSLVFHSLDKITSLFIHLTPTLVVWALKWYPSSDSYYQFDVCASEGSISFFDASVMPLVPYILWQLLYYIKVQVFDRHKFVKDKKRMTSFIWLMNDSTSLAYKVSNLLGPKHQMWMFGVFQLVYTFLTMIPVLLFWNSFWTHTIFLILMFLISAWNGASFYIEVFSVKYHQSLMELEKQWKEVSKVLESETKPKDKTS